MSAVAPLRLALLRERGEAFDRVFADHQVVEGGAEQRPSPKRAHDREVVVPSCEDASMQRLAVIAELTNEALLDGRDPGAAFDEVISGVRVPTPAHC